VSDSVHINNTNLKSIKRIWEGLFFMIWHSDKPLYQKECCEKIAEIMSKIDGQENKQNWFEAFLYIFNSHWDRVDNFRIDKYLMFIRM
jgi:ribosomal RNA-processing protein 1